MEFTGYDTIVFTLAEPPKVLVKVLSAVRRRWPRLQVEITSPQIGCLAEGSIPSERALKEKAKLRQRFSIYVYKDSEMVDHLDKKGYTLMRGGEGPLAIHSRIRTKVAFCLGSVTEGATGQVAPYEAWLCNRVIHEIGLVTPANPKNDPFSNWIWNAVRDACMKARASDK